MMDRIAKYVCAGSALMEAVTGLIGASLTYGALTPEYAWSLVYPVLVTISLLTGHFINIPKASEIVTEVVNKINHPREDE